jgi:hypothetical protein
MRRRYDPDRAGGGGEAVRPCSLRGPDDGIDTAPHVGVRRWRAGIRASSGCMVPPVAR